MVVIIEWLITPVFHQFVFQGVILPLLSLIFLPWTILMYFEAYGANGMIGFDWLWLGLTLLVDLRTFGGSAYGNRERSRDIVKVLVYPFEGLDPPEQFASF